MKLSEIFDKAKRLERKKIREKNKEFLEWEKKDDKETKLFRKYLDKYGSLYGTYNAYFQRTSLESFKRDLARMSKSEMRKYCFSSADLEYYHIKKRKGLKK